MSATHVFLQVDHPSTHLCMVDNENNQTFGEIICIAAKHGEVNNLTKYGCDLLTAMHKVYGHEKMCDWATRVIDSITSQALTYGDDGKLVLFAPAPIVALATWALRGTPVPKKKGKAILGGVQIVLNNRQKQPTIVRYFHYRCRA